MAADRNTSYVLLKKINLGSRHCPRTLRAFCVVQRYLELDDQCEQERRGVRGREKERERRERELEKKAREQADQCECVNTAKPTLPTSFGMVLFFNLCCSLNYFIDFINLFPSGGLGGAEGKSQSRTEHLETYSQQGE